MASKEENKLVLLLLNAPSDLIPEGEIQKLMMIGVDPAKGTDFEKTTAVYVEIEVGVKKETKRIMLHFVEVEEVVCSL